MGRGQPSRLPANGDSTITSRNVHRPFREQRERGDGEGGNERLLGSTLSVDASETRRHRRQLCSRTRPQDETQCRRARGSARDPAPSATSIQPREKTEADVVK